MNQKQQQHEQGGDPSSSSSTSAAIDENAREAVDAAADRIMNQLQAVHGTDHDRIGGGHSSSSSSVINPNDDEDTIPAFYGEDEEQDVESWLEKCNAFFGNNKIEEDMKVILASDCLEGTALLWHQSYMGNLLGPPPPAAAGNPKDAADSTISSTVSVSWEDYSRAISAWFREVAEDEPLLSISHHLKNFNVKRNSTRIG